MMMPVGRGWTYMPRLNSRSQCGQGLSAMASACPLMGVIISIVVGALSALACVYFSRDIMDDGIGVFLALALGLCVGFVVCVFLMCFFGFVFG